MKNDNENNKRDENLFGSLKHAGCSFSALFWLSIAIATAFLVFQIFGTYQDVSTISYSEFRRQVQNGNVTRVTVRGEKISGTFVKPIQQEIVIQRNGKRPVSLKEFTTIVPSFGDGGLLDLLETKNVNVETRSGPSYSWTSLFINLLPLFILGGIVLLFFRQKREMGGQKSNVVPVVKSGARLYNREQKPTTFGDVAGARGAKEELLEVIEFLREPARFEKLGGEIPKGVLLVGPPGTGKTLLARAAAGEADVPFLSITGSDFMEVFVGVGASRVRNLFEEAKKASPAIIFIDELDSIGRRRGTGLGNGNDEREQTLNQLLSEMDGFEPNLDIIVMAATNRPDVLDPALLRPGRFDRHITVDLPTLQDREEILKIHSRNKPFDLAVNLEGIARGTPGFSGADLENLLNEAALLAARKGKDVIQLDDIEDARDKILLGLERGSLVLSEEEWKLLAYHEGGHAVVAAFSPHADPIHKVTIVPRGRAMGVTQQIPEKEKYIYSREYILDRLAVMMGGRAAEELVFGTNTSGAENDLKQAMHLARKMVLDWGMSENFKQIAYGGQYESVFLGDEFPQRRDYSETTAYEVDQETRKIISEAYERAQNFLIEHREGLDRLVDALLENEIISGEKVLEILSRSEK